PDNELPGHSATMCMAGESSLEIMCRTLVAGRDFNADEYESSVVLDKVEDVSTLSSAVILSKPAADKMFPGGDALGKTVYMANIPLTIVGVVDTLLRPNLMGNNRDYSVMFPIRLNFANGGRYLIRVADPARRNE